MDTPRTFDWDTAKNDSNVEKHGVAFSAVAGFHFGTAAVTRDDRQAYGEAREVALGFIDRRLHVLVFTMRGDTCRVISLRKANKREVQFYAEQIRD